MFTPITLDKPRNFRYGMKAIALIERKFGKSLAQIDFYALTMDQINTVLWAGLVHEDKDLTEDRLLDIMDGLDVRIMELVENIFVAIADSYGPAGEDGDGEENPTTAAAG